MKIGVSTASLYPMHVEDAFRTLAELGVKTAEVFANSTIEAREPILSELVGTKQENGMEIVSFHPFSSRMESAFLFSRYDRRVDEMMDMYREFFRSMNRLGAKIFVLHGAMTEVRCAPEYYVQQFRLLAEAGREYGVTVAQENVCDCCSGSLEFLKMLRRELGDYARFVLDLKQARRSGIDPFDIVHALGSDIVHLHVSDGDAGHDCLPAGEGTFDFRRLMDEMDSLGYQGAYILELYRSNYSEFSQLKSSVEYLQGLER